ncbi:unnamed protein product [Oppiella nova]|uniref:E3 ubiquitin-protein ligase PPP1R11 n=1 Tax=Oppiella nova TaxID=334625 RepID=A0A7R9QGU3_9ACAR|nr:unnamed protein product [Oppiella nova]CAG2165656.1 unnamed protein product [Oppiella nova]
MSTTASITAPTMSATETMTTTAVVSDVRDGSSGSSSPVLRLRLKAHPKSSDSRLQKKVSFTDSTVDNEGLGRKKSKCCCVYQKQKFFDDNSSTDSDDSDDCPESDHCFGHKKRPVNGRKAVHHKHDADCAAAADPIDEDMDVEDGVNGVVSN